MVDEPGQVATLCSVYDCLCIDAEHIAATNPVGLVFLLPEVGDGLTHALAHILDHHLISCYRLQGKQTPVVNVRTGKSQLLLTVLK